MLPNLRRAMREAVFLTRRQDLRTATTVIQDALSGRAPSGDDNNAKDENCLRIAPSLPAATNSPARPMNSILPRMEVPFVKRSLGEVLKTLRMKKMAALPSHARSLPIPAGAHLLTQTFECAAGSRDYRLYVPSIPADESRALLVMLHGCQQDADDFAAGTRMNDLAEEFGFLVAYPNQSKGVNPSACWNWFRPGDQRRGEGEPLLIAGIAEAILAEHRIDPQRVFVAGLSAGGAMAAIMGTTYPDIFSAIGVHSGLAPGSAHDAVSAFAAMRGDGLSSSSRQRSVTDGGRRVRAIVFHGESDHTVHPVNASRIEDSFVGTDSSCATAESGTLRGRGFTRIVVRAENSTKLERWMIHGAGHAWSGGSEDGSFSDPTGPDASREMVRFFLGEE